MNRGVRSPMAAPSAAAVSADQAPPRIQSLTIRNYRALKQLTFKELTPLTVLVGPNGSGKSTVFDVLSFLSECFQSGLRPAWDRRGRAKELRTRGESGPIVIQLKYRERADAPLMTYHLAIDETAGRVNVAEEYLQWTRTSGSGRPFKFLSYRNGQGSAVSGDDPDESGRRIDIPLRSADLIAVSTLGQFAEHPRVAALREFISDWYVSYLSIDETRGQPEAGPQERLTRSGDNLANVIQFLREQHPERLEAIFLRLRQRIPRLERVLTEPMPDGRLLLQIKDAPFDRPVLSKFASDGTLKMLAYLVLLHDASPPRFIGIEEPENFLHPRLLPELAEECRAATEHSQLLVTTHSPFFLNSLRPKELRILYRDDSGFTQSVRASDLKKVSEFHKAGSSLGYLWLEGHFHVGDPLLNLGAPVTETHR